MKQNKIIYALSLCVVLLATQFPSEARATCKNRNYEGSNSGQACCVELRHLEIARLNIDLIQEQLEVWGDERQIAFEESLEEWQEEERCTYSNVIHFCGIDIENFDTEGEILAAARRSCTLNTLFQIEKNKRRQLWEKLRNTDLSGSKFNLSLD